MIKLIKHSINLIRNKLRDIGTSTKRSGKWPTIEKHFREAHPTCAACGSKDNLNIHHIIPFHIDRSLELDFNNLITLCMGKKECHLRLGHAGSFKSYNLYIVRDAAEALNHPNKFEQIVKKAFIHKKI